MANASSSIPQQKGSSALQPQGPSGSAAASDQELDQKRSDRGYNPVNDAPRGSVSGALNADAAKYKKSPADI